MTNRKELEEILEDCIWNERELTWKRYQSSKLETKMEILDDILPQTGNAKCVIDELERVTDKWMKSF